MATLTEAELRDLHDWWRAANYLTLGQIYLLANPALAEPLRPEHVKPRLLGRWDASPGLNLIYAHLNRVIRERCTEVLFLAGPGHGGPAVLANLWLEGSYSDVYPEVSRDGVGMLRLFRQFSTPGGVSSHVGPHAPGSIHEGDELGYVLTHAFGAAFDNPDMVAVAVVGDGEAETAPLEGSWKGVRFLNPRHDGAVLPVLHLHGDKVSGPTVLGRSSDEDVGCLLRGHGYSPIFVEGNEPTAVHLAMAAAFDEAFERIREIQIRARTWHDETVPRWPAIVLRTTMGWTGPEAFDGVAIDEAFRSHEGLLGAVRTEPRQLAMLEAWMRSYRPQDLFDERGRPLNRLTAWAPRGSIRMGSNPDANGGRRHLALKMPDIESYAADVPHPGVVVRESTRSLGALLRGISLANPTTFRLVCRDETNSNRLGVVLEVEDPRLNAPARPSDDHFPAGGRVMEVLSEHNCEGWLEGYVLTGRHGLFATSEAFALAVASRTIRHVTWLEASASLPWRSPVPSLNYLLTSTCWRNDYSGFSNHGPGFMDAILSKRGAVARIYLPPDANCLLSVADHCFRSHDHVNLVIIDEQPQLQWLDREAARQHCELGASVWSWAGTEAPDAKPDVVLASAGDTATLETLAAASLLRAMARDLTVRVVNVVDLMALAAPAKHPHGMAEARFRELFTDDVDVIFAFHGYACDVHMLLHGRPRPERFHVRGYTEEGATTTPFDTVVRNGMSRFHLAIEAMKRARRATTDLDLHALACEGRLDEHRRYIREHLEDMPDIRGWKWPH